MKMKIFVKLFLTFIASCESLTLYQPRELISQSAVQNFNDNMCRGRMDGSLFADSSFCHMFVECQGQKPLRRACPAGTFFHVELFFCFNENTVNCGSRQKPSNSSLIETGGNQMPSTLEQHHRVKKKFKNPSLFI